MDGRRRQQILGYTALHTFQGLLCDDDYLPFCSVLHLHNVVILYCMPMHSTNDKAGNTPKESTRGTYAKHSAVKNVGVCRVMCVLNYCCLDYAVITKPLQMTAETTTPKTISSQKREGTLRAINPLPRALYPFTR